MKEGRKVTGGALFDLVKLTLNPSLGICSWIFELSLYQLITYMYGINTVAESIRHIFDTLHKDLLDILLVEVSVKNGVCAGGRQANQVTDHVGGHQTL